MHRSPTLVLRLVGSLVRRRRAHADLRRRLALLARAERMSGLGSWQWSAGRTDPLWSDNLHRLLGYEPGEVAPAAERLLAHVHPDDVGRLRTALAKAEAREPVEPVDCRIVSRDGFERHVRMSLTSVAHGGDSVTVGAMLDVTDRRRREAELLHRALHDPLTGLPNRRLLQDRLDHALERNARAGEQVAVLLLDIDDFKAINDGLGHEAGDQILMRVAPRLVAAMRDSDTVGRYGGDEFVVICEGLRGEGDARALVERLADAWAEPFEVAGREVVLTASTGLAIAGPDDDAASVLRRADAAMYRDKAADRRRHDG